jgi:hypothetical protein
MHASGHPKRNRQYFVFHHLKFPMLHFLWLWRRMRHSTPTCCQGSGDVTKRPSKSRSDSLGRQIVWGKCYSFVQNLALNLGIDKGLLQEHLHRVGTSLQDSNSNTILDCSRAVLGESVLAIGYIARDHPTLAPDARSWPALNLQRSCAKCVFRFRMQPA